LRFNSYPVSLPIFSFLPLAVYPVGVTTHWCYFLRIIIYIVVTIYGIASKFGIRMHPYPAFQCTIFQGNQIMFMCFMKTFTLWWKEEEKEELMIIRILFTYMMTFQFLSIVPFSRTWTAVNKDEWDTKEDAGKSIKIALYVQRHGKKHLLGWSHIKQQKIQAYRLNHCKVTVY